MQRLLAALVLVAVPLAGCLADNDVQQPTIPPAQASTGFANGTLATGLSARDFIDSYIMTHPFRVQQSGFESYMGQARDDLVALLEGFGGLHVVREDYDGAEPGQNIIAYKNGTVHPDQWVVLSAHYDTVGAGGLGPTVYGAWDDGAGTATLIELARAFADWEFPFTVVFAFFDGEEKGLVGSSEFVTLHTAEGSGIDIVANLNTDPPGLNWPCGDATGAFPVKIIHEMDNVDAAAAPGSAADRFTWLYQAIEVGLNVTAVPMEVRDYTPGIPIATVMGGGLSGGSDHASFGAAGIANVFIGGTPTTTVPPGVAGQDAAVAALTYPLHTPLDTLEAMEARCTGGDGTLADGLQTTVDIFQHTLSWMAQNPAPRAA